MMQITYALTQHDLFDSAIAIRNRKKWAKWVFRASLPALGLAILFSVLRSPGSELISNVTPLVFLVLLWAFLLWGSPWWLARTQFAKRPSSQGQRTASFDSNGVGWQWNGGSSAMEWQTFIRWMETKNQILLCSSPVECATIPKRSLNSDQLLELRTLLAQKIGPGLKV